MRDTSFHPHRPQLLFNQRVARRSSLLVPDNDDREHLGAVVVVLIVLAVSAFAGVLSWFAVGAAG